MRMGGRESGGGRGQDRGRKKQYKKKFLFRKKKFCKFCDEKIVIDSFSTDKTVGGLGLWFAPAKQCTNLLLCRRPRPAHFVDS